MSDNSFGGSSSTSGYTDTSVSSSGIGLPTGRAMANGSKAVLITHLRGYVSGRGASRSIAMSLGSAKVSSYSEGSGSSASSTGWKNCSDTLVSGGSATFKISGNGSFYFGRGGSGSTSDSYGTDYAGKLGGGYQYVQAPTAPTAFSVTILGPGSVSVGFGKPSDDGDGTISGYVIEYATNAQFTGKTTLSVTALATTINGLAPGSTYYFRAAAKNECTDKAGSTSVYTAVAAAVTAAAPSEPTNPAIGSVLPTSMVVSWSPPDSDGGDVITGYELQWTSGAADFTGTVESITLTDLQDTVTDLTPGTTYLARVRASNDIGPGPWSAIASARTPSGAYVSNGTTYAPTEIYIGDGNNWQTVEVYAGDGTHWNAAG